MMSTQSWMCSTSSSSSIVFSAALKCQMRSEKTEISDSRIGKIRKMRVRNNVIKLTWDPPLLRRSSWWRTHIPANINLVIIVIIIFVTVNITYDSDYCIIITFLIIIIHIIIIIITLYASPGLSPLSCCTACWALWTGTCNKQHIEWWAISKVRQMLGDNFGLFITFLGEQNSIK